MYNIYIYTKKKQENPFLDKWLSTGNPLLLEHAQLAVPPSARKCKKQEERHRVGLVSHLK